VPDTRLRKQVEVLSQGVFNASFIALPAFIMAINPSPTIAIFEILGLTIWLIAFSLETLADRQKLAFLVAMKKANKPRMVCNVGLWRYTRHPNYFAEWMVWNGVVIAAIPSWLALYSAESVLIWALLGLGLLMVSYGLLATLVRYTGAVPSEYYSAQKRPGYKAYQQQTNQFFPGPRKTTLDVNSPQDG
jgi:steroid 5-alpha reductase family enzyme